MSDDNSGNQMRKSTKAALGVSFALLAIDPLMKLKNFVMDEQVVTNARIERTLTEGFQRLEKKFDDHIVAEVDTHRRIRGLGREELAAAENRCEKSADKLEIRVLNIETALFKNVAQNKRAIN